MRRSSRRRFGIGLVAVAVAATMPLLGVFAPGGPRAEAAASTHPGTTTAWQHGRFALDSAGVVSRSDLVFGRANTAAAESVPLGNGRLGAAVWAADGFTAQLNRNDTQPDRKSPGQLVIPGLSAMTTASDYSARLDLHDAEYVQRGGGMTATTRVLAGKDELVVDVTGAEPGTTQTARLQLWAPRTPTASAAGRLGTLADHWTDTRGAGATHATFGSLAGITAGGRQVRASVVDPRTVQVAVRPDAHGNYRIVVAAPHWTDGSTSVARSTAARTIGADGKLLRRWVDAAHLAWWHRYWSSVGLIEATSADGAAQYMENLRTIYLYQEAASERDAIPGSQAGVADLFSWNKDTYFWDASAYWHWNLRMMTGANLGAGAFSLNAPYFALYRNDLPAIQAWTKQHMGGRPGICIPETMRFNGVGYENETWLDSPGLNCDAGSPPYYNARTITTGAEVGLWVWQQYRWTGDEAFLRQNYPLMREAARFLLSYAQMGADGMLHTYPSNAHETQWDVHDPTTDIAAMRALFPAVRAAAARLHTDRALTAQLAAAERRLLPFPTTGTGTDQVIAPSYDATAENDNVENIGLEPVWPYGLIGDTGPGSTLAKQTFAKRPYVIANDWSFDPVDAATLGLGDQVQPLLTSLVRNFQVYPDGMGVVAASFTGQQPYSELSGIAALTMNQALVTDQSDEIRVGVGWPSTWSGQASEYVHGRSRVDVEISNGTPSTVVLEAGSSQTYRVRNPWPGQRVEVVDGRDLRHVVVRGSSATDLVVPARAGHAYVVQLVDAPLRALPFAPVTGIPATAPKSLAGRTLGLAAAG